MNDTEGQYTLHVTSEGSLICHMPVQVLWVGHESESEPFLGIRTENPEELRGALTPYQGKSVELKFTPIEESRAV